MPEWFQSILTSSVVTASAIWIIQKYLVAKIKHDFDLRLEALKPLTAAEALRQQNYLNSKREAYFEAISVITRYLEAVPWGGPDIPADRLQLESRPSESEVNACLAKLSLYSGDLNIPSQFLSCFDGASPVALGRFVNMLRRDLGHDEIHMNPEEYKYFFRREPEQK